MRYLMSSFLIAGAFALGGCLADASVGYSGGATVVAPNLVYVEPGVQVIADYDQPVFYSDNYYWRYDNGLWYRSGYLGGGWAVNYNVPVGVRGIGRERAASVAAGCLANGRVHHHRSRA